MQQAKDSGWWLHEKAFAIFLGTTAVRLFASGSAGFGWGLVFTTLLAFTFWLRWWSLQGPGESRFRLRLLSYFPLMLVSYRACGFAVPIFHPGAMMLLAQADRWLLGRDAALFLEPWMSPPLTDLFFALYLFFFVYLVMALWDHGRGDLMKLRRFISGLFTVYGLGFLGYTLLPAGGPYLEIPGDFSTALTGGWITRVCTALVAWGSNRVDCFPCLHFGVTFFILVFDFWHCRRRCYVMAVPCLGIWISTIYLRQHYFVDLLGGLVLSTLALWLVRPGPPRDARLEFRL